MTRILIPKWDRFQPYRKKRSDAPDWRPPWIAVHTRLAHNENYRTLTLAERGLLLGIWIENALSNQELPADTEELARRLGIRAVRADQLQRLRDLGFIHYDQLANQKTKRRRRVRHASDMRQTLLREASDVIHNGMDTGLNAQSFRNDSGTDLRKELPEPPKPKNYAGVDAAHAPVEQQVEPVLDGLGDGPDAGSVESFGGLRRFGSRPGSDPIVARLQLMMLAKQQGDESGDPELPP